MEKNPTYTFPKYLDVDFTPSRNYFCPNYDECLEVAARKDFALCCNACSYNEITINRFVLTLSEINGCLALVRAIFSKKSTY